jgi:putative zinc finger/helix-turn-helix YgiT family protein
MKGAFCPNCEEYTETTFGIEKEVYNVRGEPIEIEAEVTICQKCGEKIFDEERDSRNLEKAYSLYRDKHNLLPPDEIRLIREKYGLSQRALSRLLGWGEITIHRYENGAIQDNAHDKLLRLIEDPQNMQRFFETNQNKLPSFTAARLEKRIASFLQEDKEQAFQVCFERLVSHQQVDLTSGFKKYDLEKYKNMILYLVKRLNNVLKVKLNKLLWYCDFLHFKETSVSITGTQYIRLQLGPVPNNYDLIIDIMLREGLLNKNEPLFQTKDGIVPGDEFTALVEPDKSLFSEQEIKVMDFVADTFRNDTSTSIMNKSHQETAYKKCEDGEIISYEYAQKLSLSLPR